MITMARMLSESGNNYISIYCKEGRRMKEREAQNKRKRREKIMILHWYNDCEEAFFIY